MMSDERSKNGKSLSFAVRYSLIAVHTRCSHANQKNITPSISDSDGFFTTSVVGTSETRLRSPGHILTRLLRRAPLCALLVFFCSHTRTSSSVEYGISYAYTSNLKTLNQVAHHLKELGISSIRHEIDWASLEPAPNRYRWKAMDTRVAWAQRHGIGLMITIRSNCPEWAGTVHRNKKSAVCKNEEAFHRFVTLCAKRYANIWDIVQFGNEWQDTGHFVGTENEFVRFSNIVFDAFSKHSPRTRFALGGFSCLSLRYLALDAGLVDSIITPHRGIMNRVDLGALPDSQKNAYRQRVAYVLDSARYDYIDIHLYDDWEQWPEYVGVIQEKKPEIPIIVSEFGGPNARTRPYSESLHAEYMHHYLSTIAGLPVKKAYYFSLLELRNVYHHKAGLMSMKKGRVHKKKAFAVFKKFMKGGEPFVKPSNHEDKDSSKVGDPEQE